MNTSGSFDINTARYDYETSIKKVVDENALLNYLRYLAFKDYHIEIYKIIKKSKSTKGNIFEVLELYSAERPDLINEIKVHLTALLKLQIDMKNIIDRRDKIFAHLDKDYLDYGGQGALEPFENVFKVIENVIVFLTSQAELQSLWDKMPSDLHL